MIEEWLQKLYPDRQVDWKVEYLRLLEVVKQLMAEQAYNRKQSTRRDCKNCS